MRVRYTRYSRAADFRARRNGSGAREQPFGHGSRSVPACVESPCLTASQAASIRLVRNAPATTRAHRTRITSPY